MKIIYYETKEETKKTDFQKALCHWPKDSFPALMILHKNRIIPVALRGKLYTHREFTELVNHLIQTLGNEFKELREERTNLKVDLEKKVKKQANKC